MLIPIPKASTPPDVAALMNIKIDEFKAGLEDKDVRVVTDKRDIYTPG